MDGLPRDLWPQALGKGPCHPQALLTVGRFSCSMLQVLILGAAVLFVCFADVIGDSLGAAIAAAALCVPTYRAVRKRTLGPPRWSVVNEQAIELLTTLRRPERVLLDPTNAHGIDREGDDNWRFVHTVSPVRLLFEPQGSAFEWLAAAAAADSAAAAAHEAARQRTEADLARQAPVEHMAQTLAHGRRPMPHAPPPAAARSPLAEQLHRRR